ncbi:MAG: YbaB/EbfC family nucleoid-associated protein [Leptospira sp.]|nr:YbaB/EbfC family nucleoid-associated protein [Leptospira sp.]
MFDNPGKLTEIFSKMNDLKKQMEEAQKRVSKMRVSASAGAGMVTVTVTGDNVITNIEINKALFTAEDAKMLEDLIISATNEALKKAKESMAHEMKAISGSMVNPEDFNKFFGGTGV